MSDAERLLRDALEKTTPGPWEWSYNDWCNRPTKKPHVIGDKHESYDDDEEREVITFPAIGVLIVEANATSYPIHEHNANFVCLAKTHLPALLAEFEAKDARITALGQALVDAMMRCRLCEYDEYWQVITLCRKCENDRKLLEGKP